jgi:hypothetical protein
LSSRFAAPAGLSWNALKRVLGSGALFSTREKVIEAKMGILQFLCLPDFLLDHQIISHLIVASGFNNS